MLSASNPSRRSRQVLATSLGNRLGIVPSVSALNNPEILVVSIADHLPLSRFLCQSCRLPDRLPTTPLTLVLTLWDISNNISPVWNPNRSFLLLLCARGKPYLSVRHICRNPRPIAIHMDTYLGSIVSLSGVLAPTQQASYSGS